MWGEGIPSRVDWVDLAVEVFLVLCLARGSAQRWDVLVTAPVPSMGLALPQGAHHKAKPSTSKAQYSIAFIIESNRFSPTQVYIYICTYTYIYIWFNVIMVSSRYGVALWSSWFFGKCLGLKELAVHFGRPPKTRKASDGFCFSESLAQFRLTWCNGLDPPHFEPERWCLLYPSIFKNTTRILLLALDFIQGDHGARRSLWPVLSENSAFWRQGRGSDGWDGIGILD